VCAALQIRLRARSALVQRLLNAASAAPTTLARRCANEEHTMSQASLKAVFVKRAVHRLGAFWALGALAFAAGACSAAPDDEATFAEDSEELAAEAVADEEAASAFDDGAAEPIEKQLKRPVASSELPNATCEADRVFGNVICVECTTGPFPACNTYVCDREGKNCHQTSRRLDFNAGGAVIDAVIAR
jgi:hypothetical protein